ncbi:uncharacterized protein LTR77_001288 [Saxophila tyrrhenica]|uniref:Calcium uniporter protein n=1 Tax=Saxophila tyrrhenica TaxID=1690608 RepID=A0AAV9PK29_9PEZI|nr:hypothetical protein LTR77_001288 [Saxophila tyrrhenica]
MEPFFSRTLSQLAPRLRQTSHPTAWPYRNCRVPVTSSTRQERAFTNTATRWPREKPDSSSVKTDSDSIPAADLSQNVTQVERSHYDAVEEESKEKQMRSPWMRDGSEKPPVARNRSAGAMTKGKLLTTPSRMLKLILPLTTRDANNDRKDVEPLALLVHPQQPLSYLERLIQSELPVIKDGEKEKIPKVTFRAQDSTEEDISSGKPAADDLEGADETMVDGKRERTGKIKSSQDDGPMPTKQQREHPDDAQSADPEHPNFVRWSPSTEIGDFIRDAARGSEFAVDIEGAPESIYIGVPSFDERTFYLRMRLRKVSKTILQYADLKRECDNLAQRGAQRVAQGGFAGMVSWWAIVYYLTFKTDLGWDVMEPVTYLVGLTGLMGGYMWFLYHNREASYRSAMNFTISRRQSKLYEQKGFNLQRWEGLVEEGNRLRREIQMVADEYDEEWDEHQDEGDSKVSEALRKERRKNNRKEGKAGKKEDGDGDDDD